MMFQLLVLSIVLLLHCDGVAAVVYREGELSGCASQCQSIAGASDVGSSFKCEQVCTPFNSAVEANITQVLQDCNSYVGAFKGVNPLFPDALVQLCPDTFDFMTTSQSPSASPTSPTSSPTVIIYQESEVSGCLSTCQNIAAAADIGSSFDCREVCGPFDIAIPSNLTLVLQDCNSYVGRFKSVNPLFPDELVQLCPDTFDFMTSSLSPSTAPSAPPTNSTSDDPLDFLADTTFLISVGVFALLISLAIILKCTVFKYEKIN